MLVAVESSLMDSALSVPVKLRVTAASARHLAELGIETVGDALRFAPRRYYHWGSLTRLDDLVEGEDATVLAQVTSQRLLRNRSGSGVRLLVDITDGTARLTCTFFAKRDYALSRHRKLLQVGETFLFAGKISAYQGSRQLVQPTFEEIDTDSPEAIERRRGRPIAIYPAKASLPSWKVAALIKQITEGIDWAQISEILPEDLRLQQGLLPLAEAYRLLHEPEDDADWQNARRTLAWNEALVLKVALLQPRIAAEKAGLNRAHPLTAPADSAGQSLVTEVIDALPFNLTKGQQQSWLAIEQDLGRPAPMQRLLQADVGAGKTVLALLAMLRTVESDLQAALLAPTEVLARQHLISLQKLLGERQFDVPLHLLTASQALSIRQEVLMRLAAGEPGIVVGTHALLQDKVELPGLGLLVVDEQHRFGVAQREKLRENREYLPHLLVMTATPIPRTIAMTVFGDLDVTAMKDMPPGRAPISTYRIDVGNRAWMTRLWQRAREEIDNGGRVYVVCPRIDEEEESPAGAYLPSIERTRGELQSEPSLQGIAIAVAHGQNKAEVNAQAVQQFQTGESPLLLATTVVEVGVDVPEATMMIILGAQQFGLSQLHQLRGRVGRSDRASVCMLVHASDLSPVAEERLEALVKSTDGFTLAETDLRLRKEGNVLGQKQSGLGSSLQFLSVRRDAATIATARDVAAAMLEADANLQRYPGLRAAVAERVDEELVWLERS